MRRDFQPIFVVQFIVPNLSIAIAIAIKCLSDAPTRKCLFYFISSQGESYYLLITSFHPCSALIPLISTGSCCLLSFLRVMFSKVKISSHLSKQDSCAINKKFITSTLTSRPGSSCFARCFIIPKASPPPPDEMDLLSNTQPAVAGNAGTRCLACSGGLKGSETLQRDKWEIRVSITAGT